MPSADAIEVILRLRNLNGFLAGTRAASAGIKEMGVATEEASVAAGRAGKKLTEEELATRRVAASQKAAAAMGGLMRKALLGIGAAAAVAGVEGYKMAINFDRQMEMVHTQAGQSQTEVTNLRAAILKWHDLPQSPIELSKALYRLEGAGIHGKHAMDALRQSAELAAVGNANVEDTAKAVAQTYFSGIKGVGSFRSTVSELNATVGQGDLRLQQLVDALGVGVLPAAANAGLSLQDVTGAMAVFGDQTNNVSGFMAQFATALHFISNPGQKATAALEQLHLKQDTLARVMHQPRGMLKALEILRKRLDELPGGRHGVRAGQILGDIFPGGRGRVLQVLLNQLDRYRQKMDAIKKTHESFGEAWDRTMKQPAVQIHTAWANVQRALIIFGDVIKGPVTAAIVFFLGALQHTLLFLSGFVKALGQGKVWAWLLVAALGSLTAGFTAMMIVGKLIALLRAFRFVMIGVNIAIAANPIGAIIAAVVAAGVAFYVLYTKVKWFHNAVNAVWSWIKAHWPLLVGILTGPFAPLTFAILQIIIHFSDLRKSIFGAFRGVAGFVSGIFDSVKGAVSGAISFIKGVISDLIDAYNSIPLLPNIPNPFAGSSAGYGDALANALQAANNISNQISRSPRARGGKHLPGAAAGGYVMNSGLLTVGEEGPEVIGASAGATVVPLSPTRLRGIDVGSTLGSGVIEVRAPLYMDGRLVAEGLGRVMKVAAARS